MSAQYGVGELKATCSEHKLQIVLKKIKCNILLKRISLQTFVHKKQSLFTLTSKSLLTKRLIQKYFLKDERPRSYLRLVTGFYKFIHLILLGNF